VFLDTNVLASAFGTRGLCADVVRLVLAEHELVTSEVVIEELRKVLRQKFGVSANSVREIESFLRDYKVEPNPRKLPDLSLSDRNDLLVIGSAIDAGASLLVTGDKELLDLKRKPSGLSIVSPRDFWTIASRRSRQRD
jgi:uncharacterized protein